MKKSPKGIPEDLDKYELASELYYWENERKVPIGGSQDAFGSVYPGVTLLHYDFRHHNGVLPKNVTSITNQRTTRWFERNLWIVDCVGPRPEGYNPFDGGRFLTGRLPSSLASPGKIASPRSRTAMWTRWAPRSTFARLPGERYSRRSSSIPRSPCP